MVPISLKTTPILPLVPVIPRNLPSIAIGPFEAALEEEDEDEEEDEVNLPPPVPPPRKKINESVLRPAEAPTGNVSRYYDHWPSITKNSFILSIVRSGYCIQFHSPPEQFHSIISNPKCPNKRLALRQQIARNLQIGSISVVSPSNDQFLSRVFCVKKSNGEDRMIIDLSHLNSFVNKVHFKMESLDVVKSLLRPNDYMVSIDLADAFLSIPLHESSKKYTTFEFENVRYWFNSIPFGLTSSPRIFSKVLRPVIIWLRSRGLRITSYLDDIFICDQSPSLLSSSVDLALDTLSDLGFKPNLKKSKLSPSRDLLHLGYLWDTISMTISLPPEKINKTKVLANHLLSLEKVSLRDISSFLGLVISHSNGLDNGSLHFRKIQLQFVAKFKSCSSWDSCYCLSPAARNELFWWSQDFPCVPVSLSDSLPDLTMHCDASLSGWGCTLSSGHVASGEWSNSEKSFHINYLELKAIFFGLKCFSELIKNKYLQIFSDNTTSVSYINKRGGTHSSYLCSLAITIWEFSYSIGTKITASHIAGTSNSTADFYSRHIDFVHDYSIPFPVFNKISEALNFFPKIDLFASRLSSKLPRYYSYKADPYASGINAFLNPWPDHVYMFPPINIISMVLKKFYSEKVSKGLLVTPAWPGLPDIPVITDSLIADPILIPGHLLQGERPTRYEFPLVAWLISTESTLQQAYHSLRARRCSTASQSALCRPTSSTGLSSMSGLMNLGIHLQSMFH